MKYIPFEDIKIGSTYLYLSIGEERKGKNIIEVSSIDAIITVTYKYSDVILPKVEFDIIRSFCSYIDSGEKGLHGSEQGYRRAWGLRYQV